MSFADKYHKVQFSALSFADKYQILIDIHNLNLNELIMNEWERLSFAQTKIDEFRLR